MAYSPAERYRAQKLFADGASIERLHAELGYPTGTLKRWSVQHNWMHHRRLREQLRDQTVALLAEMTQAARRSADPQQVFAAAHAAKLAGVFDPATPEPPKPLRVVEALLDVLALHPEVGPPVRRHRGEVIRLVMRELERIDPTASPESAA